MSHLITVEQAGQRLAIHPDGLAEHQRLGWIVVRDAAPVEVKSSLDHDGDGNPDGSLPASERGLDDLRAEAEALGIKADRRWGEARLRDEIAKAKV